MNELAVTNKGLALRTLEDMRTWAMCVLDAKLAPSCFRTSEAIIVATQFGAELGFSPMQALQSIAVINGKPSIYGQAAIGLVKQSGLCEYVKEYFEGEGEDRAAVCESLRKGEPEPVVTRFSVDDAKRAGLWGKSGPWTQYPQRMIMYRARGFNLRDNFADVLMGMHVAEELDGYHVAEKDYETENMPQTTKRGDRVIDVEITRTTEMALAETIAAFKEFPDITGLTEEQASVMFSDYSAFVLGGSPTIYTNPERWTIDMCDRLLKYMKDNGMAKEVLSAHVETEPESG